MNWFPKNERWLRIGVVVLCLGQIILVVTQEMKNGIFWDFEVYRRAVLDVALGLNPYRTDVKHCFVYHPVLLDIFVLFDYLNLKAVLGTFYIAILMAFCSTFPRLKEHAFELLVSVAFGGFGALAIGTGNLTLYLHLALLSVFFLSLKKDSFFYSYIVILLAALIKPYFLAYLFIPLLVQKKIFRKDLAVLALGTTLLIGVIVFYNLNAPDQIHSFLSTLTYQTVTRHDFGLSFFNWAWLATRNIFAATVAHFFISSALLVLIFYHRFKKTRFSNLSNLNVLLLSYIVMTILNPRMKQYDLFPALICLFTFCRNIFKEFTLRYIAVALIAVSVPTAIFTLIKTF
jgi:hypothetical protein